MALNCAQAIKGALRETISLAYYYRSQWRMSTRSHSVWGHKCREHLWSLHVIRCEHVVKARGLLRNHVGRNRWERATHGTDMHWQRSGCSSRDIMLCLCKRRAAIIRSLRKRGISHHESSIIRRWRLAIEYDHW